MCFYLRFDSLIFPAIPKPSMAPGWRGLAVLTLFLLVHVLMRDCYKGWKLKPPHTVFGARDWQLQRCSFYDFRMRRMVRLAAECGPVTA